MSLGILIIDLFQSIEYEQKEYTYPYGPVNLGLALVGKVLESAAAMNLKIFAAIFNRFELYPGFEHFVNPDHLVKKKIMVTMLYLANSLCFHFLLIMINGPNPCYFTEQ